MYRQIAYIIQGFLLFLLIPIGGYIIAKICSVEKNKLNPVNIANAEMPVKAVASEGKTLFIGKCAPCHHPFKDGTGPALKGLQERGQWRDRKKLYEWIRNPASFMQKDPYTNQLKEKFGSVMTAFPDLSNKEIDAIVDYIDYY